MSSVPTRLALTDTKTPAGVNQALRDVERKINEIIQALLEISNDLKAIHEAIDP